MKSKGFAKPGNGMELKMYKVIDEEGPAHDKIFTVGVYLSGVFESQGTGKSKKDAEQMAAEIALQNLKDREE